MNILSFGILNKLLFILFVFLTYPNLFAQEHVFRPGILLNFNGIEIRGENNIYWTSSNGTIWGTGGISFGGFVTYDTYKKITGTLELRYSRKGSLYEFVNDWGQRDFESLKLFYIEMPVLIGVKGKTKNWEYNFETGFGLARLLNSELLFNELTERIKTPNAANFKKYDISWIADFKSYIEKSKTLLLGFRFEYSIMSIHNTYNLHNLVYGIELNYLLFSKKINNFYTPK